LKVLSNLSILSPPPNAERVWIYWLVLTLLKHSAQFSFFFKIESQILFSKSYMALTTIALASTILKQPILVAFPLFPTRYDLLSPNWLHHSIFSLSLLLLHQRFNARTFITLNRLSSFQWRYPRFYGSIYYYHDRPSIFLFLLLESYKTYTFKTSSHPSSLIGSSTS
jgi:hypothetical protein